VRNQGGFGFIAHPFEKGMPFLDNRRAFIWKNWAIHGYTGICIWNFASRWKENVRTIWHGIFHLIFKKYTLKGPSKKTLAVWDNLCLKRHVVAIGGSDAHGSKVRIGFLSIKPFSYRYLLGTINTHIVTAAPFIGDLESDKLTVYNSLRQGNCFVAHDGLFPAKGFRFFFRKGKTKVEMGQESKFSPGDIIIRLPKSGLIKIIRSGSSVKVAYGNRLAIKIYEKGVYRAEVFLKMPLFG